jgi:hypothetical protein
VSAVACGAGWINRSRSNSTTSTETTKTIGSKTFACYVRIATPSLRLTGARDAPLGLARDCSHRSERWCWFPEFDPIHAGRFRAGCSNYFKSLASTYFATRASECARDCMLCRRWAGTMLAGHITAWQFPVCAAALRPCLDICAYGAKPLNLGDSRASYLPPGLSPCQPALPAIHAARQPPVRGLRRCRRCLGGEGCHGS